jgi:hypothetical protein
MSFIILNKTNAKKFLNMTAEINTGFSGLEIHRFYKLSESIRRVIILKF